MVRFGNPALTALFIVALSPLAARDVHASACCLSASVLGPSRLTVWEQFAMGLNSSAAPTLGHWDHTGALKALPKSYSELELRTDAWSIVRLHERVQAHARLPFIETRRATAAASELGGGVGDMQAGVRYEVFGIGEFAGVPAIALTGVVTFPTSRRAENAQGLGTNATGRGAWASGLGLSLERVFLPYFVRVDLGVVQSLPVQREDLDVRQAYGPGVQAGLAVGAEVVPDALVIALQTSFDWEGAMRQDNERQPYSASRSLTETLGISWQVSPHWAFLGAASTTIPSDHVGRNRPHRIGITAGARYGYF